MLRAPADPAPSLVVSVTRPAPQSVPDCLAVVDSQAVVVVAAVAPEEDFVVAVVAPAAEAEDLAEAADPEVADAVAVKPFRGSFQFGL